MGQREVPLGVWYSRQYPLATSLPSSPFSEVKSIMNRRMSCYVSFASCCLLWILAGQVPVVAEEQPASGIAATLKPFVDEHTLAGAVTLVASRDKILDLSTVGYADIAAQKPMRPDQVVWIASMTKAITAAAVMVLVDEGKLSLDDPIEKHLPEFKNLWVAVESDDSHKLLKRPASRVTIRQTLCHTSGMAFKSDMEVPTLDLLTVREATLSYAMTPLLHEPGTKYVYSNCGINTAGRICEVVSGMPYEVFLDQRVLAPLEMKDTTFWPSEEQMTRLAKHYTPSAAKNNLQEAPVGYLHSPYSDRSRQPMPGGGLFSTATDVAHFCQMLLADGQYHGKRILSEESVKQIRTKQTEPAIDVPYGLGVQVSPDSFGHGGALSTNMTIDRKHELVLVYLVQHSGYANSDGGQILPAFHKTAIERFGKK